MSNQKSHCLKGLPRIKFLLILYTSKESAIVVKPYLILFATVHTAMRSYVIDIFMNNGVKRFTNLEPGKVVLR